MARLKGQDNLTDLSGKLTAGFNAVTLKTLGEEYAAAGPSASKALTDFFLAAARLQSSEKAFNNKAKPRSASDPQDLKSNLRDPNQLKAARAFETAKQDLLAANPEIGAKIVAVVEHNLLSSTKPGAKPAARRAFAPALPAFT